MSDKIYLENWNGIFDLVEKHYAEKGLLTNNQMDASVVVLWQDVRSAPEHLARLCRDTLGKPVVVMQHGRGATRDYGPPNNFKLLADKIMVWGQSERLRLLKYGVEDHRIAVTGCPLIPRLLPRDKTRMGKNVLFVPVIAEQECPENLLVYSELKIWETKGLQRFLNENMVNLKKGWAIENNMYKDVQLADGTVERRLWSTEVVPRLPRNITYQHGLINCKLTGLHDAPQYMSPLLMTNQNDPQHIANLVEMLMNTDVVVCLEEGTLQLLATALDIPVIVVDIFKYGTYGGMQDYDKVEKIKSPAAYWLKSLHNLQDTLDYALAHPEARRQERIQTVEHEGGANLGDITKNVVNVIEGFRSAKRLLTA